MTRASLFFIAFLNTTLAFAFPEMIRHHYVNCGACHVNQNGGGLINAYGRTISAEVLSTWGKEKEARAFYSIDPEKISWLNVGGDVRSVQTHFENETVSQARHIWMEVNIQVAAQLKEFTFFTSVGKVEQSNQSLKTEVNKYYVSFQKSDELSFRIGKYIPIYGMNLPQHNFFIKQNLQLGPATERSSADVQWNGEEYNFLVGISKSDPSSAVRDEEMAFNAQIQKNIKDQHKIGASYWYGEASRYRKFNLGAHAVSGWTEKFYSLFEIDSVWSKDNNDVETKSIAELLKLGYEFYRGVHFHFVQEHFESNGASNTKTNSLGVGLAWYPRPHFEFETLYSKRKKQTSNSSDEDSAYLLLHYYF
jgi:hypothetical protein